MKTHQDYIANALIEVRKDDDREGDVYHLVAGILAARCVIKDREIAVLDRAVLEARQRITELEGLLETAYGASGSKQDE